MKISDTKEFNHEVLKQLSDPRIHKTSKQMYERIVQIMQDEFRDVPAGMAVDTFKLIIFNVIRAGMEEQSDIQDEKEKEFYR